MSCQMCVHYCGLQYYCTSGHLVHDASISIACDDYQYNQELKVNSDD